MRAGIELRSDFSAGDLRRLARHCDDTDQTRRLLSIAVILDGGLRSDAARTGSIGLQVKRNCFAQFDAKKAERLPSVCNRKFLSHCLFARKLVALPEHV